MKARKSPGGKPAVHAAQRRAQHRAGHDVLALQHTAGNQAVAAALAPAAVQRTLLTQDLEQAVDLSTASASLFGRSSFGAVVTAAKLYDKSSATDHGRRQKLLERVEAAALQWLNSHKGPAAVRDAKRRQAVDGLLDRVANERRSVSKHEAQDTYMAGVAGKGGPKNSLKALSPLGQMAGVRKPPPEEEKFAKAAGLSPAEVAAIKIFTAPDYEYINPATSGAWGASAEAKKHAAEAKGEKLDHDPNWMRGQQSKWQNSKDPGMGPIYQQWAPLDEKTLTQEGSLHTGVALAGLEKLEKFSGQAFRGERLTQQQFDAKFTPKKMLPTTNLSSASTDQRIAFEFALGIGSSKIAPEKDVAVIMILEDTGARDISPISLVKRENEVVLLPGAGYGFAVESIKELSRREANALAAKTGVGNFVLAASKKGQPLPRTFYVVHLRGQHKAAAG